MKNTPTRLSPAARTRAAEAYAALYARALPRSGGIDPARLEIAPFNLSSTWAEFQRVGLGLETVVIFRDADGSGHTGKVLLNLPWQLLPEHGHVDTFVLRPRARVPRGFVELARVLRGFRGIRAYHSDGSVLVRRSQPVYAYPARRYRIVQAEDGARDLPPSSAEDAVAALPGKSETFKAIYGDGVLFADEAVVLHAPRGANPDRPPASFRAAVERVRREQAITTRRLIYMAPGTNVLLPKRTKHAFLAGPKGAVYLEFSTPSMDEADRFTDSRVVR